MSEVRRDDYDIDLTNLMRLKVNKVNLIQALKLDDDFIADLMKMRIINYEEAIEITKGKTREDKCKALLEVLLSYYSNNNTSRKEPPRKDWYLQFRSLLLQRNYNDLVVFLDNTIIKKPKYVAKFTDKYQSSINMGSSKRSDHRDIIDSEVMENENEGGNFTLRSIYSYNKNVESDAGKNESELYEKSYEFMSKKIPSSYSNKPFYLLNDLEKSEDPDDLRQLEYENITFDQFNKLETLYSVYLNDKELPKESFFLDSIAVKNVFDSKDSHMFMKYYKHLLDTFNIDLLNFYKQTLIEKLREGKIIRLIHYEDLDELLIKVVWVQIRNERYGNANEILLEYFNYLTFVEDYLDKLAIENNKTNTKFVNNDNSKRILFTSRFYALSNLIIVKNNLSDYKNSIRVFDDAMKLLEIYNEVNVDQNPSLNTTLLYYAISNTYLELGHFDKSFEYINECLKTLNYHDEILIDVLATACLCYSNKWLLSKAESFSILSIQLARFLYGRNHSDFIRALLCYCYFSNEYLHDESSVQISHVTLNLAKKVYGYDSIQVAEAYRNLSKALTISKIFREGIFYEYANKSYKIACEYFTPNNPKLINYKLNLVSSLQWRSINSNIIEIRKVNLNDAYNKCIEALKTSLDLFGQYNFMTAKIYRLLASLFYYMERDEESEKIHKKSLEILSRISSETDLHYLLAKSTMGVFYKMTGQIDEASIILLEVVNSLKLEEIQSLAGYCKWIASVYSNLHDCYRIKKQDQLASYYQKQSDDLKAIYSSQISKQNVLNDELINTIPPLNLNEYLMNIIKI